MAAATGARSVSCDQVKQAVTCIQLHLLAKPIWPIYLGLDVDHWPALGAHGASIRRAGCCQGRLQVSTCSSHAPAARFGKNRGVLTSTAAF